MPGTVECYWDNYEVTGTNYVDCDLLIQTYDYLPNYTYVDEHFTNSGFFTGDGNRAIQIWATSTQAWPSTGKCALILECKVYLTGTSTLIFEENRITFNNYEAISVAIDTDCSGWTFYVNSYTTYMA